MLKSPLFPKSLSRNADLQEVVKWIMSQSSAISSFVADLMTQLNWQVVDSVPTETPTRIPCIKIYESGSTYRLYIYYKDAWRYIALT
jgi:hypothetical protein